MMATRWNAIIQKQGLDFQSFTEGTITKFKVDKVEGFGTLDHEVCFVKAYPRQSNEHINIFRKSSWQHFKPPESARSLPKGRRIPIFLPTPR